jgi:methyl-accepting chemotaxis protein
MNFIRNLSLRTKFTLILLIPLSGLVLFGVQNLNIRMSLSTNMAAMDRLSGLGVRISSLVHETQKERGMTAGYLGSKGKQFSSELPRHRTAVTNLPIEDLHSYLQDFDTNSYGSDFSSSLASAMEKLSGLDNMRKQVDRQSIKATNAISYYTKMNADFLNVVGHIGKLAANAEMASQSLAYVNFLKGKERAGIERAVLTNTFARKNFAPDMYLKFSNLVSEQSTYFSVFTSNAPPEQTTYFNKKMRLPVVLEVKRMRDIAFNNNFDVDPNLWFKTITSKINLLKEVENRLSNDLATRATLLRKEADAEFIFYLIFTIFVVIVAMFFGIFIAKEISRQLGGEPREVRDIAQLVAQGDLTTVNLF